MTNALYENTKITLVQRHVFFYGKDKMIITL
jgi:hypothetical protein